MQFFIEAQGAKQVQTKFERMGAGALDAAPAFERIALLFYRIVGTTFESQGRRGGGSWRRDTPDWSARKARLGLDPRIGFAGGTLFRSLTEPDNENQILEIGPQSLRYGSKLPYAETQQANRPFIKLTPVDKANMRTEVRNHLLRIWRTRVA